MKFDIRRVAAAGAVSALAAGALVATASTATATTQPATNAYMCTAPTPTVDNPNATTSFPISVTSSAPDLAGFPTFYAGATVPAALQVSNHFLIPTAAVNLFMSKGIDHVTLPDIGAVFSGTDVLVGETGIPGVDGTPPAPSALVSNMTVSATPGFSEFDADGQNKSLTAPAAGEYELLMPQAFNVSAYAGDIHAVDANCVLTDTEASSLHHLTLLKNASTTTAKATRTSFVKGKTAKVLATVSAANRIPSGKVLLKNKAGKTLDSAVLNSLGKATLSTTRLPVGKNALKVLYRGDGYTTTSNAPVTVKIVR